MEIVCPRCGWRNAEGARMCGGCGQPLVAAYPSPVADETPTIPDVTKQLARPDAPYPPPYAPSAPGSVPQQQQQRPARQRRGGCLGCGSMGCLVSMLALLAVLVGGWAFIVRPVLHATVNTAIETTLDRVVDLVPVVPPLINLPVQIDESEAEAVLDNTLFARLPVHITDVTFTDEREIVTYSAPIGGGTISTHLVTQDGKLVATQTQVLGLLGWVESGDELQSTLNEAFGRLPNEDYLSDLSAKNGTLSVSVRQR